MAEAHTSMYMKLCESTPECTGKYTILLVEAVANSRKQVVKCDVCNQKVDRFKSA